MGTLYILPTKQQRKKGTIVAMIAGTKAQTVIAIIEKYRLNYEIQFQITRYGSKHGGLIAKMFSKCNSCYRQIPCAKLALEALQKSNTLEAIDQENEAIEKPRKTKKV
jgi:hypothetical protein